MFQQEFNGYKKSEVDAFIQSMRANYETKLMAEKFKVLDAEKKLLELSTKKQEIEFKEQNIKNVIEKQKKYQEEGSMKINSLVLDKLEFIINELEIKFPQHRRDKDYAALIDELEKTISSYKENLEKTKAITHPVNSENDSMRMLLNKMQNYKKNESKIESTPKQETKSSQKPSYDDFKFDDEEETDEDFEDEVDEEEIDDNDTYESEDDVEENDDEIEETPSYHKSSFDYAKTQPYSKIDKPLYDTKPKFYEYESREARQNKTVITPDKKVEKKHNFTYIPPQAIPPSESGFSFQEALNPTEDLEEIMKAFDFYNDNNN